MILSKKHRALAIRNRWWQSMEYIGGYILERVDPNRTTEIEFHAEKFQKEMMELRQKPYDRTLIPKAIKRIAERSEGLIQIVYDYGKGVWKLRVHPISFLNGNRNKKKELGRSQNPGNHMFSNEHKEKEYEQQQQFIEKIDQLLRKIGLIYDHDALNKIWRLSGKSIERVVNSIEFLLHRNSSENKIQKPHGFLIQCLRFGWSDGFDIYYEPELPTFNSRLDIKKFVSGIAEKAFSQGPDKWSLKDRETRLLMEASNHFQA